MLLRNTHYKMYSGLTEGYNIYNGLLIKLEKTKGVIKN